MNKTSGLEYKEYEYEVNSPKEEVDGERKEMHCTNCRRSSLKIWSCDSLAADAPRRVRVLPASLVIEEKRSFKIDCR